jgi:2-oxoglutarate dehydrogenase E2 component (dihydrolipoamide succinyltransferase)
MADIMTPTLGESVAEATVAKWSKKPGDAVRKDEILVELETDKVSLEVAAPSDGVLSEISAAEGDVVVPGTVLGKVTEGVAAAAGSPAPAPKEAPAARPAPVAPEASPSEVALAPSVKRIVTESGLDPAGVAGTGKDGRITKGDALAALETRAQAPVSSAKTPAVRPAHEREERVRMSRLRQTIARRLKEAQQPC